MTGLKKLKQVCLEAEGSAESIRARLRAGDVLGMKAKVLLRDYGADEALIELDGVVFLIDTTSRLVDAKIPTDFASKTTAQYFPGIKNVADQIALYKSQPKLGFDDFKWFYAQRLSKKEV